MQEADKQVVHQAVDRNAAIVFSLPSAGILRHHKSRFLAETPEGIWIEAPAGEGPLIEQLLLTGQPVGISFRHGHAKIIYSTPLCRRDAEYRINAEVTVEAVLTKFPDDVKTIQRRNNYRVPVPLDSEIKVRVWRLGPGVPVRDRPMSKQEVKATVRDLSLGGVGVILEGEGGAPPKISDADRLRISVKTPSTELILEGRLRYPGQPDSPSVRAGIQFKSLDKDLDGRQTLTTLTRIVGELTRAELRRLRIGLPNPVAA